jgi:hypothetical protein
MLHVFQITFCYLPSDLLSGSFACFSVSVPAVSSGSLLGFQISVGFHGWETVLPLES